MEVCIVKPDRIFFKEEAEELLLPTSTGYIGILKEHAPLVTGLDNGVLAVRQGTSWKILALLGGFGVIKEDRVNILCRDIEDAAEIDVEEAQRRVAEARTGMHSSLSLTTNLIARVLYPVRPSMFGVEACSVIVVRMRGWVAHEKGRCQRRPTPPHTHLPPETTGSNRKDCNRVRTCVSSDGL